MRRLAVISLRVVAASLLLLIVAIFASVAVIYVTSSEDMEELVVVRGSRAIEEQPWLSGKHWALDVFLVDHDQVPEVRAVVNGELRICQTAYLSTVQIHIVTVHIPAQGPCQVTTTRIP